MKIEVVKVGYLETNCYIVSFDNHVLVIDPGDEYNKIKEVISSRIIDGILITHSHFDHIGVLSMFDNNLVYDYNNLKEGNVILGNFKFEVISNPGHTEDSISFYFDNIKVLFCGDFIFHETIGRTDLEGGNMTDMINSIRKTKRYSDEVVIYPGHGSKTTFAHEREYNIYFNLDNS